MKKIVSVKTKVTEEKTLIILALEGQENPVFLTNRQVTAGTDLRGNFGVLKGSKLEVTYYKKGDKMNSGTECSADDKIVKEFTFELSEKLNNIGAASAFGASMF